MLALMENDLVLILLNGDGFVDSEAKLKKITNAIKAKLPGVVEVKVVYW